MSKRSFLANSWLQIQPRTPQQVVEKGDSYSDARAEFRGPEAGYFPPPIPNNGPAHPLKDFFIPGWSGQSLFSKSTVSIQKVQKLIWSDVLYKFKKVDNLPQRLRSQIFSEFLEYLRPNLNNSKSSFQVLEKPEIFWRELQSENSPFKKVIESFLELYTFRVAHHYLARIKFFVTLSEAIEFNFSSSHILNPSTFAQSLLKKGSSHEIFCEALKVNQYSWYRPSPELEKPLMAVTKDLPKLSITQMMKLSSQPTKSGKNSTQYSHALSHKAFGQFVNLLIVFLPLWKKLDQFEYPQKSQGLCPLSPEVLNTLFIGENIDNLGHGHWLAQQENSKISWSELICPQFAGRSSGEEAFIRLGQEIHFLTFLIEYAKLHKLAPRQLLSRVTKERYETAQRKLAGQTSLFSGSELIYDRIVMNYRNLPKKNPLHFLLNKIREQKEKLLVNGHLIIMTNQKLFVPSQSKKVAQILEEFKIEATFNLEKLKGKGEVAQYFYILSKRDPFESKGPLLLNSIESEVVTKSSESVSTFIFDGDLSQFGQFEKLLNGTLDFFNQKSSTGTPFFFKSLSPQLNFEYHQDVVIDGKLLSSINSDKDSVIHPQFFKNVTRNSKPFEHFFSIKEVQKDERGFLNNTIGYNGQSSSSYLLVVDYRDSLSPELELFHASAYLSKRNEYGEAFYSYFLLSPKIKNLNLNLFKEFFSSSIGKQIIQICLSGGQTKLKGRLLSLLIPMIFAGDGEQMPEEYRNSQFLKMGQEDYIKMSPEDLNIFIQNESFALSKEQEVAPWAYLGILIHTKQRLKAILDEQSVNGLNKSTFNNKLIVEKVAQLPVVPVYPNEEVYTELHISNKSDLERPLGKVELKLNEEEASKLHVYSGNEKLITFHAEEELIQFINFILSQANGYPILMILQNLKVPSLIDLQGLMKLLNNTNDSLEKTYTLIDNNIQEAFTKYITRL